MAPCFSPERVIEEIQQVEKAAGSTGAQTNLAQAVINSLETFYAIVAEQAHISRPKPYYAILVADGDSMGKAIDQLAQRDNDDQAIAAHQAFSERLDAFAQQARSIIRDQYQGAPIYTGGDDILAFLPLYTAIDCASTLAAIFHDTFIDTSVTPTLSAGLAIVHHLDPLRESLSLARKTEGEAKAYHDSKGPKDALAITVNKRSGIPIARSSAPTPGRNRRATQSVQHMAGYRPTSRWFTYELRTLVNRFSLPAIPTSKRRCVLFCVTNLSASCAAKRAMRRLSKKLKRSCGMLTCH